MDVYIDVASSKTGSSRKEFNRMIDECMAGNIDMIVTESISRFARNMLDCLKCIGDALLQKTYTLDFLTKKRVKNDGIVPQYYVENNHEPIIPRDLYLQVQEEMAHRTNIRSGNGEKKRVYSSKYALSSIVYCGECGDIYRRVQLKHQQAKFHLQQQIYNWIFGRHSFNTVPIMTELKISVNQSYA